MKHRNKIIAGVAILAVLVLVFWWGGNAPGLRGFSAPTVPAEHSERTAPTGEEGLYEKPLAASDPSESQVTATGPQTEPQESEQGITEGADGQETGPLPGETLSEATGEGPEAATGSTLAPTADAAGSTPELQSGDVNDSVSQGMDLNPATGKDKYLTEAVPEGKPLPVEPQDVITGDTAYTCTLSVRCDTILDNLEWLDQEKYELVPEDGVIFAAKTVTFYEGESVFNVLQREMRQAGIHMSFVNTPIYNSAYVQGINNLYEFDCGELSGWMYQVNGWFPNYGCSRYQLSQGDVIEWVYTCDLGKDVGGYYAAGGQ